MARPRDPANSIYQAGSIRVVNRKPSGYRVLWTEGKRPRERRTTTIDRAKEAAHEEAALLWTDGEEPASARTPFGALVSVATDPRYRTWTEEWASRVEAIARNHIIPSIGGIPASQVTRQDVSALLGEMAAAGYSHHFIKHTRNVIKLAVDEGIQRGMWEVSRHPRVRVTVPPSHMAPDDGRPNLTLIPTDDQVTPGSPTPERAGVCGRAMHE